MTPVALQKISFLLEINRTKQHSRKEKKMKIARLLTAVLLTAILTGSVYAQKNSIKDITPNKHALENIVAGIHSDNTGVKRSSIYFAGKYRIAETEEALIAQLKAENDPSTRILIALVLYEMGSEAGLLEVKDLSMNDKDAKVRRMTIQIYNEYLINDGVSTVLITE
jgi:HEAT repeat protein